jgi:hypothetical protein
MNRETELYSKLLESYISEMLEKLNLLSEDQWCWQPSPPVPSAQMLATNALEWMICDRQHINEPDAKFHDPIPPTPVERECVMERLSAELKEWVRLLSQIRVEDLEAPRRQFNRLDADDQNVRWMMLNAVDNVARRLGELTPLWLALGHGGADPYQNKLPHECYERLKPQID